VNPEAYEAYLKGRFDAEGSAAFDFARYRTANRQTHPTRHPGTPLPGQYHGPDRRIGLPDSGPDGAANQAETRTPDRRPDQGRNRPGRPADRRL